MSKKITPLDRAEKVSMKEKKHQLETLMLIDLLEFAFGRHRSADSYK